MSYPRGRYFDEDGDTSSKRPRRDDDGDGIDNFDMEEKLQNLIVEVGSKSDSSMESNLENLLSILEANLQEFGPKIIEIISSCVVYMPHKLTIYSTLVGLLNAKNFNFGGEIVEKLTSDLRDFLDTRNYSFSLYIIIFLSDLANTRVITYNSLVEFLDAYVALLRVEDAPQGRKDWFAYTIMHTLPWVACELAEKKPSELDNILDGLEAYMNSRKRLHVPLLRVWTEASALDQAEYVDSLWLQIKSFKENGWLEKRFIQRYYVAFDAQLGDALQHNLQVCTPPEHRATDTYPMPWVVFRLFDYTDCPEEGPVLPGTHSIERFLLEEELTWIIEQNCLDRERCAYELLNYPRGNIIPLAYCVLEILLAHLFRLPRPIHHELFYASLIVDFCKLMPEVMPQAIAQAMDKLCRALPIMQPICVDRFVNWFSFHISNFGYRWTFMEWKDSFALPEMNLRRVFSTEMFERCKRLAYVEYMQKVVPEELHQFLPPKTDFLCDFEEDDKLRDKAAFFESLLQERVNLDRLKSELLAEDGKSYDQDAFAAFLGILWKLAAKSISHNFSALMRYHKLLKSVCESNDEMQAVLLKTLFSCWRNNQQFIVIIVDKFIKAQVIDVGLLVEWIFSEEMRSEHHRQWVWELLNDSVAKFCTQVVNARHQLKELEAAETRDEEQIEDKKQQLEHLLDFEKNLMLAILHKFALQITEHALENSANDAYKNEYHSFMLGRMQQIFLTHDVELWKMNDDLAEKLFSETDIQPDVVAVYQSFVALHS